MTEITQHSSVHAPSWAPHQEQSQERALIACDLCGEPIAPHDFSEAAYEASGMNVCGPCLEDMLNATAFDARAEVGLVGSGGGRS